MKKDMNDILKKRRDFFFDRLKNIERISATCKILQKDITNLFLENYEISKSQNLIELRRYLDLFQAEIKNDEKYLTNQLDKINKQ